MISTRQAPLRYAVLLLFLAVPLRAEYLRIELKVYGLDCELCARGVSASIGKLAGVQSVKISLQTGLLQITLAPGNSFKMSDLRKRIRQNGFRAMQAKVTALGIFRGSRFEVLGTGESYPLDNHGSASDAPTQITFETQ